MYVEWIASDTTQCKGPFVPGELYSTRLGKCCDGSKENVKKLDGTYCRSYQGPSASDKSSFAFGWVLLGICACCGVCLCFCCSFVCILKCFSKVLTSVQHRENAQRQRDQFAANGGAGVVGADGIPRATIPGNQINLRAQLQLAGLTVRPETEAQRQRRLSAARAGGFQMAAVHTDDRPNAFFGAGGALPVAMPIAEVVASDETAVPTAHVIAMPAVSPSAAAASFASPAEPAAPSPSVVVAAAPQGSPLRGGGRSSSDGSRRESLNPMRRLSGFDFPEAPPPTGPPSGGTAPPTTSADRASAGASAGASANPLIPK